MTQFIYSENYFFLFFCNCFLCHFTRLGGSFKNPDKFCPPSLCRRKTHASPLPPSLSFSHSYLGLLQMSLFSYFISYLFLWFCSHFFSSSPCSCSSDLRRCFRGNSILNIFDLTPNNYDNWNERHCLVYGVFATIPLDYKAFNWNIYLHEAFSKATVESCR